MALPRASKGWRAFDERRQGPAVSPVAAGVDRHNLPTPPSSDAFFSIGTRVEDSPVNTVEGGVLRLANATAIAGGIGSSGGLSNLTIAGGVSDSNDPFGALYAGGVVELTTASGDFSRGLGTGVTQVRWTGNGGFSAFGGDRIVNLGGAAATATWTSGNFVPNGSPTSSVNDVLRLTSPTAPFASPLGSGNAVNVLFSGPLASGTYTGGFFTDRNQNFYTDVFTSGSIAYWVSGAFGTVADQRQFAVGENGAPVTYSTLSAYNQTLPSAFTVTGTVAATTGTFTNGAVSGQVTQFVVVPEPQALALAAIGVGLAGFALRRRSRG